MILSLVGTIIRMITLNMESLNNGCPRKICAFFTSTFPKPFRVGVETGRNPFLYVPLNVSMWANLSWTPVSHIIFQLIADKGYKIRN